MYLTNSNFQFTVNIILGENYEKNIFDKLSTFLLATAFSGGWETGRLDSSFMYEEGGYGQFGVLSVNYDVGAEIQHPLAPKHKMAKNQNRSSFAIKMGLGDFDLGLTRYHSGIIQLDGLAGSLEMQPCYRSNCLVFRST